MPAYNPHGHPIIDEDHPVSIFGTGYIPRDFSAYPLAPLKCSRKFSEPLFTDAEIQEIIDFKDANNAWLTDIEDRAGLPRKNQQESSYCWIHAPVHLMELDMVVANEPMRELSAFYAGALIKNGRNQGGSGIQGIEWLAEHGTCLQSLHLPMDFSTHNSVEAIANASLHKIIGHVDIEPDNERAIWTQVCKDQGVTVGIPKWGHEVGIVRLRWDKKAGRPRYIIDNSWGMEWGKAGRGELAGAYEIFDEAGSVSTSSPGVG